MPGRYARAARRGDPDRAGRAATWLEDVDGGFYVACYLRAWALEAHWRAALRERFGERWFASPRRATGCARLWRSGQRLDADELLAETLGVELDFGVLADGARPRQPPERYLSRLLDLREDALAGLVALLVGAHLAQLGRAQVGRGAS